VKNGSGFGPVQVRGLASGRGRFSDSASGGVDFGDLNRGWSCIHLSNKKSNKKVKGTNQYNKIQPPFGLPDFCDVSLLIFIYKKIQQYTTGNSIEFFSLPRGYSFSLVAFSRLLLIYS
jgi:hypothetical protein